MSTTQIPYVIKEHNHATKHCPITSPVAHFAPSSRLIDAIAAKQGAYKRQNTRSAAADAVAIELSSAADVP